MNRSILGCLWLAILIITAGIFMCPSAADAAAPNVSADASCLYEVNNQQVLWGRNIHQKRPPASTTKMMTAIVIRSYCEFDEKVEISEKADRTGGTSIGVRKGQVWQLEDLLKAAMAKSANDACVAMAEHVAGSEPLFGMLMTKKACIIGARQTNFVNASGLPNSKHYSSAYDLAIIGAVLQRDAYLKKLVAAPRVEIKHPAYPQGLTINNTNRLLTSYPGANGIKTGTTDAAGNCLVASASRDGRNLVAVVLHSNDRYRDSRNLLDYGYRWVSWVNVLTPGEVYKYVRVKNGSSYRLPIQPAYNLRVLMDGDEIAQLQKMVDLDYNPRAPIKKGQRLGQVKVYYYGEEVGSVPLVAGERVARSSRLLPW